MVDFRSVDHEFRKFPKIGKLRSVEATFFQYLMIGMRSARGSEEKGESMLKIERSAHGDFAVFSLSGRIEIQDVAELQRLIEGEDRNVILDLAEVTLVDRDVVRFLARCETGGIKLEHCPAYVREWIVGERDRKTGD